MMEKITTSLRESKTMRWTALILVSFTMLTGYFISDVMSPLKPLVEAELQWSSTEYGIFTGAYGWINVFCIMLILGGIILDVAGIRFTCMLSASIMLIGTAIKYWAISTPELNDHIVNFLFLHMRGQVFWASIGFAIFGVGVEMAGITVSKTIVKWFKGKEMALAMGLEMATARIGSALALIFAPLIAESMGSVSKPVMFGLILLCIGFITFFIYIFMDKRLDESEGITKDNKPESEFRIKSIGHILSNKAWWYIAIMCVLFYSAVFPFLKYASDLMVNKFNIDESISGIIPGILPFGTILLTPLFGNIYDRIGKGVTLMIIGSFLITLVHLIFSIPGLHSVAIAVILVILLGIGFSLVPSAMWPSVAKIIPESELGTAYALIFWIQNWGLMGVPMLIGWVLDKYCISGQIMRKGELVNTYDYTLPMIIFAGLSAISIIFAFLLLAENKRKKYSLQLPNIEEKIKKKQEDD